MKIIRDYFIINIRNYSSSMGLQKYVPKKDADIRDNLNLDKI